MLGCCKWKVGISLGLDYEIRNINNQNNIMEFPVYYYLLMHSTYLYVDKTHACLISTDIFINHRSVNSCKYKCKRGRKGGVKGNKLIDNQLCTRHCARYICTFYLILQKT